MPSRRTRARARTLASFASPRPRRRRPVSRDRRTLARDGREHAPGRLLRRRPPLLLRVFSAPLLLLLAPADPRGPVVKRRVEGDPPLVLLELLQVRVRVQPHLRLALRLAPPHLHLQRHELRGRTAGTAAGTGARLRLHARGFALGDEEPGGGARRAALGRFPGIRRRPRGVEPGTGGFVEVGRVRTDRGGVVKVVSVLSVLSPLPGALAEPSRALVGGVEVRRPRAHLERAVDGDDAEDAVAHRRDAVPLVPRGVLGDEDAGRRDAAAATKGGARVRVAVALAGIGRELDLELLARGLVPHRDGGGDVVRAVGGAEGVLQDARGRVGRGAAEVHGDATDDAA